LAVAILLAAAGVAAAGNSFQAALAAARTAIAEDRVGRTKVLGCYDDKHPFSELHADGALLTGFDLGVGMSGDIETVYAVRPLYWTRAGDAAGADRGLFRTRRGPGKKVIKSKVLRVVHVQARPGYAVGAVTIRSGLNINGLSVTFMKINGATLDSGRSYTSEWVGDRTGGGENTISGDGAPAVGLFGSNDEEHIQAFGLYFVQPPPAEVALPAEPPRPTAPPQRPATAPKVEQPALPRAEPPPRAVALQQPAAPQLPPALQALLGDPPAAPADPPRVDNPAAPLSRPADPPPPPQAPAATVPQKEQPPLPDPQSWLLYTLGAVAVVPLFAACLASVGRRRPAPQAAPTEAAEAVDVLEEVDVSDAGPAVPVGLSVPGAGAIATTLPAEQGPNKAPSLPPALAKGAAVNVRLPDPDGRWPPSAWVGGGAAVALGTAAMFLLAPELFPATEENLFVVEKVLFSTAVSAVGGFLGWALVGRVEAGRA
jgi:hypothetical protein